MLLSHTHCVHIDLSYLQAEKKAGNPLRRERTRTNRAEEGAGGKEDKSKEEALDSELCTQWMKKKRDIQHGVL